ncbi:MAG: toxic anion resistance protein, partial [Peptococcaceae bacterium]|nr:toxic anion resistance protein [Peptococcaceae bacterium]
MTNTMPQLTLEPQLNLNEQAQAAAEAEAPKAPETDMKDVLNTEEQQAVDAFAKQIDITNANQVLMYGANAQKNIASFSENALNNVRNKDLGEVGEALSGLVVELKSLDFDTDEEEKGFFAKLFKKSKNQLEELKAQFSEVEVNVDKISAILEQHQ